MSTPKYCYYIEVPPFEMIIQKGTDEGMEEVKQMIKDDSLSICINTGGGRKISMSDDELKKHEKSAEFFSLSFSLADDLITPNGVKGEILKNNQIKISTSRFIYKYQPETFDDVLHLEPQLHDLENLHQVVINAYDFREDTIISYEGVRGYIDRWMEPDWSSDEDPRPEIECVRLMAYIRVFAVNAPNESTVKDWEGCIYDSETHRIGYADDEPKKFDSIQKLREYYDSDE
jgi:hypothetical protein